MSLAFKPETPETMTLVGSCVMRLVWEIWFWRAASWLWTLEGVLVTRSRLQRQGEAREGS